MYYDNFVKAEQLIILAKTYQNDLKKQEELYKRALEIQLASFKVLLCKRVNL